MCETQLLASYYHIPDESAQQIFYTVVRGGHIKTAPSYVIQRRFCNGQDLLFCLRGKGEFTVGRNRYLVSRGQLAWIDGRQPHTHAPDPDDPWELLWFRFDSRDVDALCTILSIARAPRFEGLETRRITRIFRRMLRILRDTPRAMDPLLHAEIAGLVAALMESRSTHSGMPSHSVEYLAMEEVLMKMTLYYYKKWTIKELAQLAGLSEPQFFRIFRKATGSTPVEWLRRERMRQAKRMLVESDESIATIAERVGYPDPFYFSRNFRRLIGVSPSQYRAQEQQVSE